jgi:hypothetical protein
MEDGECDAHNNKSADEAPPGGGARFDLRSYNGSKQ